MIGKNYKGFPILLTVFDQEYGQAAICLGNNEWQNIELRTPGITLRFLFETAKAYIDAKPRFEVIDGGRPC